MALPNIPSPFGDDPTKKISYGGGLTKSLLEWREPVDQGGHIGHLIFDAVPTEEHTVENKVTEIPVESGFIVSDHVIRKNRLLKLEIVSVNARINRTAQTQDELDADDSYIDVGGAVSDNEGATNRVKADFDTINTLVQKGHLVNVTTILGVYANCVISKFVCKSDVNTATSLVGTMLLKELNIVGEEDAAATKQALLDLAGTTEETETEIALEAQGISFETASTVLDNVLTIVG